MPWKMEKTSVAFAWEVRLHAPTKSPKSAFRSSMKSAKRSEGQDDSGPDLQSGIGIGAWLTRL